MMREYVLYGSDISLFTRKMEAALRFYAAPFRRARKNEENRRELETRSGTHQVPVLRTPENWVIADSTPLIDLLDERFAARRLVPEGAAGVMVHVLEDICDEWVSRVMVHYRWHYEENIRSVVSTLQGREVSIEEAREFPLAKWGPRACRATGTETAFQQRAVEREYLDLLGALERQLGATPFALGQRPTSLDAILLGGLRGHTHCDPIPDLSAFAAVRAWDEDRADRWDGDGALASFPASTPFARHLAELGRTEFAPFVLANARALAQGDKAFAIETHGASVSYLTRSYPEHARRMVHERIRQRLDAAERAVAEAWLEAWGLAEVYVPRD